MSILITVHLLEQNVTEIQVWFKHVTWDTKLSPYENNISLLMKFNNATYKNIELRMADQNGKFCAEAG